MASYPYVKPLLPLPTATTQFVVKQEREHEHDNEDAKEEPKPRKRVTISRKLCIICTEDVPKNRFPKIPHSQDDNDKHTSDVCFKCFSEHLSIEVVTKGHEGVGCPQCSQPLEESEIRKLASSWTYQEQVAPDRLDRESRLTRRSGSLIRQLRNACNKKKSTTFAQTPSALGVCTGLRP